MAGRRTRSGAVLTVPDVTPETTLIAPIARRAEPEPDPEPEKESPLITALKWLHATFGSEGRLAIWGPPASVRKDHVQLPSDGPGTWAIPPEEVLAALRAANPGVQAYGSPVLPTKLCDAKTFDLLVS